MNIFSQENIQWIFSGCGVAIVSGIVLYVKKHKNKTVVQAPSEASSIQSGNHSNNVISKGSVNINITEKN